MLRIAVFQRFFSHHPGAFYCISLLQIVFASRRSPVRVSPLFLFLPFTSPFSFAVNAVLCDIDFWHFYQEYVTCTATKYKNSQVQFSRLTLRKVQRTFNSTGVRRKTSSRY